MNEYTNMSGEEYTLLYERFLDRSPRELLFMAGMEPHMVVMDLCCGPTFRLTNDALEMGADEVHAVDNGGFSIAPLYFGSKLWRRVKVYNNHVYDLCIPSQNNFKKETFDIIACQQGINYWFDARIIQAIHSLLKVGGRFVFNTFNTKPSDIPTIKSYSAKNGDEMSEVAYSINDTVWHIQIRKGMKPHVTSFGWIPSEVFMGVLCKIFVQTGSVLRHTEGNSDIYICRKELDIEKEPVKM